MNICKNTLIFIASILLFSCGETQNDVGETEQEESICSKLSEADCENDQGCTTVFGALWDSENQCLGTRTFAYCATQPINCNNAVQDTLYDPSTENCWVQSASCVPSGWQNLLSENPDFPESCEQAIDAPSCEA